MLSNRIIILKKKEIKFTKKIQKKMKKKFAISITPRSKLIGLHKKAFRLDH